MLKGKKKRERERVVVVVISGLNETDSFKDQELALEIMGHHGFQRCMIYIYDRSWEASQVDE